MQQKKYILGIVLLLCLGLAEPQAQNLLLIKEKNGSQTSLTLNEIRKLTFNTGNILVNKTDGYTEMYDLHDIRYLYYADITNSSNNLGVQENKSLVLFPNPANDKITILFKSDYNESILVDFVDIQGKTVYREIVHPMNGTNQLNINVSIFTKGLYICRLNNRRTIGTSIFLKN